VKTRRDEITPYLTKDGSEIRELLHPVHHGARHQSLAEARVPPGCTTLLHRHEVTEEIYHVTAGTGVMTLGEENFPIGRGDSILIPPGTPHCVTNTGDTALLILCCCAPAYSHDDTVLLEASA
jgi:mannose-6-phosphate isomerase-like protein (cupin superfamily)